MKLDNRNLLAICTTYLGVILLFSITISLLCFQLTTAAAAAPTNETDRLALLKFKEMILSDPFNIFSSWNDSIHLCKWHGITCGRKHQRVTALYLPDYTLSGSISPYISNLSFLRVVDLSNNFLHGEIPQQVTHMFRLQRLRLSNNSLTGEISSNFTNCPELRVMQFLRNKLSGNIPVELGSLLKLERLEFFQNNLTGGIPPSLGNISTLEVFDFSLNNLEGNIPDDLGRVQGLSFFGVGVNNLSEYGMGGKASAQGDVYSYGIFVLEMFTGKRPTDKMFKDGFNLHNFVNRALPEKLVQIVDPNLFKREVNELAVATEEDGYNYDDHNDNNDIEAVEERVLIENINQMNSNVQKCLLSVFKIGLTCSLESPKERMNMEDVMRELHRNKNVFLEVGSHG